MQKKREKVYTHVCTHTHTHIHTRTHAHTHTTNVNSREIREEMERARGCESTCIHYDLGTEQVIGVLQLVLCTWVAAIGC